MPFTLGYSPGGLHSFLVSAQQGKKEGQKPKSYFVSMTTHLAQHLLNRGTWPRPAWAPGAVSSQQPREPS